MPPTGPKGPEWRNRHGRQTTEYDLDESQIEVADVGRQMTSRQAVGELSYAPTVCTA